MMPTDSNNGESRLDRMERMLDLIIRDHATFDEHHRRFEEDHRRFDEEHRKLVERQNQMREDFERDYKMLLTSQVLMNDALQKLTVVVAESRRDCDARKREADERKRECDERKREADERHKDMDERFTALIQMMDEWIRRNPLPPQ